jgi:hypothetical protein
MCLTAAVLHSGARSFEDGCQRRTAGSSPAAGDADEEGDPDAVAEGTADGVPVVAGGALEDAEEHPAASAPTPSSSTERRGRSTGPA